MTQDLTSMTPAQIDEEWSTVMLPAIRIEQRMHALRLSARRYRKAGGHYYKQADEIDEQVNELENSDKYLEALDADIPFKAEWDRRGGWARYHGVMGGKVHRPSCHTITPGRTLVGLVYEASGFSEEEVVARFEVTACTHCFKDAPVESKEVPSDQCEHSGTYAGESLCDPRWANGAWASAAVAPSVRCSCGYTGSITKSGLFRKHKVGG